MNEINLEDNRNARIVSIVLILSGFILPYLPLHLGFYPWKDEEYELLCMADYKANPLTGLTMYIGYIWSHYIGSDTFLSFRRLAYFFNTLSIAVPVLYYFRKTRMVLSSAWIFLVLQFAMSLYSFFSYEWDTLSNCLISLTCVLSYSFFIAPDRRKALFSGILGALCIFSRIPNVSLLLVFLPLIIFSKVSLKKKIEYCSVFLIAIFATSFLICEMIWGGISDFVSFWNPDNVITGHSSILGMFFGQIIANYSRIICLLFMWGGFLGVYCFIRRYISTKRYKLLWYCLLSFAWVSVLLAQRATTVDNHNYYIELFLFLLLFVPVLATVKSENFYFGIISSLLLFGYLIVSMGGSDCGIAKLPCLPLFPLMLLTIRRLNFNFLNGFLCVLSTAVVVTTPILRVKDFQSKDWIIKYQSDFGEIPVLEGIRDSEPHTAYILDVYNKARLIENSNKKILFIGPKRYMFDYILGHSFDRVDRYPVQRYHDDNHYDDVDTDLLSQLAEKFDYIQLSFDLQEVDSVRVAGDFHKLGYEIVEFSDNNILLKQCQFHQK